MLGALGLAVAASCAWAGPLGGEPFVQLDNVLAPCIVSPDGAGSVNYFSSHPHCQSEGPAWTIASEIETATGGIPCTATIAPPFQSDPVDSPDGAITASADLHTIKVGQAWNDAPVPTPCASSPNVWSWVGLLDHNPSASEGGIVGRFGDVRGSLLPSPQTATESLQIAFGDYTYPGQADQAFLDYAGIWGGCYNFIEVTMSDRGDTVPTGPVGSVWHDASYPALSNGCFNYVSINGSYLLNGDTGFIPPLRTVEVQVNWGNVISFLQGQTGCPVGTEPGGCVNASGTTPVLPAYGKGAATDVMGVAEQTMETTADIAAHRGPSQLLAVTDAHFWSQTGQRGFGYL
jgi:hypothetical protein